MTPAEAVLALVRSRERVERAEIELERAKRERKELEELILPPIFLQNGNMRMLELENGARAIRTDYAWCRLAKPGDPKRANLLKWLGEVGEADAIKATLTAKWSTGEYDVAKKFRDEIVNDGRAAVELNEDVHWKTLETIVLDHVHRGEAVPLDDINATYGAKVVITRNPTVPETGGINGKDDN